MTVRRRYAGVRWELLRMHESNSSTPQSAPLTVLYDGARPLCRREISLYAGVQPGTPVCYVDVSAANVELPAKVTREQLLARFHVQDKTGTLRSGARAFLLSRSVLPGWRWLARLGQLPGAAWTMEVAYRLFLRVRPLLQRMARHCDRSRSKP
jgi:3-demethoxyubiquinol 3-hydroxylase